MKQWNISTERSMLRQLDALIHFEAWYGQDSNKVSWLRDLISRTSGSISSRLEFDNIT